MKCVRCGIAIGKKIEGLELCELHKCIADGRPYEIKNSEKAVQILDDIQATPQEQAVKSTRLKR